MAKGRQALGKGLGALIGGSAPATPTGTFPAAQTPEKAAPLTPLAAPPEPGERVELVPLSQVVPSPLQPRKSFHPDQLEELMGSIREHGIIQPLIVRQVGEKLELIAGERRWRASGELGLAEVPVIRREASDQEVLELALIENLQREDLNPIEEAVAYQRLRQEFSLTQEQIATRVGKSRAAVANTLRLLDLAAPVRSLVESGQLTAGHAKAILGLKDEGQQQAAATQIIARSLNVRATEKLVSALLKPPPAPRPTPHIDQQEAAQIKHVESRLRQHFATNISLHHAKARGKIEIEYYGSDDLDRILAAMGIDEEFS
jgi:ParB family transcriptional regulator, chromosome partitioning protein